MAIERWKIDTVHSGIHFWVRHMVVSKVHGRFTRWSGSFELDPEAPQSASAKVRIEADSIDTSEPSRDKHLRSADFLEVERFPELTFESTRFEKVDATHWRVVGQLTVHGVSREVTLDSEVLGRVKGPDTERIGVSATTALDRKDFGLVWNKALEAGGVWVGDRVEIQIELEAAKESDASNAG